VPEEFDMSSAVTDYDQNDYDYRAYWDGRDYEAGPI
jgi:hypothetical protein